MSTSSTGQNFTGPIVPVPAPKPQSRTAFVIIGIIFVVVIIIWIIVLVIMFTSSSGLFADNYTRPVPSDTNLIAINGEQVTLTAEEKAVLKTKVQEALANISAAQNG